MGGDLPSDSFPRSRVLPNHDGRPLSFLLANLNTLSTIILRSSSGVTFLKSNVSLKLFLPSQSTRSPRPSFSTSAAGTDATDALGASPNAAFDLFP